MCNEAARQIALGQIRDDFNELKIPLRFPEGLPNLGDAPSIRITDTTPIVRADANGDAELVTRRWSWPGPTGKPVYNFRSDGRKLDKGRCLVPVDAFYEFTTPANPMQKRKDKWAFRHAHDAWFCIGGLWRVDPTVGEAFTMLTTEPGPDVAPYHSRQMVVVARSDWAGWLDGSLESAAVCRPLPADTLNATQVR